jgi:hypothetical protein
MAAFPHSYAKILAEGYEKSRPSAVIRTEMEDGMVKQLRSKARVLVKRNMTVGLASLANYQSFVTWFQTDIDYGAQWFDFTDPEDNVTKDARIVSQLNAERPLVGTGHWRVSMVIETWSNG